MLFYIDYNSDVDYEAYTYEDEWNENHKVDLDDLSISDMGNYIFNYFEMIHQLAPQCDAYINDACTVLRGLLCKC